MTTFTTDYVFPKPSGTDSPDRPGHIGALADAVDTTPSARAPSLALFPNPGTLVAGSDFQFEGWPS